MAEQHRMDNGSGWPGASRPGMPPQSGMGRMQGAPGNRPSAPPYGAGFVRPEQPRYDEMRMHPLQQPQQGNGIGTAGFVLSIVGVCFGFVPFVGVVCCILAIVFSAIGLGRRPRGQAIAGLVISVALPLILIAVFVGIFAIASVGDLQRELWSL